MFSSGIISNERNNMPSNCLFGAWKKLKTIMPNGGEQG